MSSLATLVETVAQALADTPEDVQVTEVEQRGTTVLELFMAPGELGRVIGRQGRTAAALRTLVTVAAERQGRRAQVEFRDGHPAGR